MATNIFSIGQSALAAAQAAQATTSHNLSNATTPGYNRQVVVQSTAGGINYGYGFVGQGTQVAQITRVYDDFLNRQLMASQTSASSLDSYYAQISQINNVVADTSAGLSPALQDFFSKMQALSATPNNTAARQAVLSGASTMVARFQSLDNQMSQSRANINSQITASITSINSFASQISQLNATILKASNGNTAAIPNDLLDQRDQAISKLNALVQVTSVPQSNGSLSIFIGNGQPLVLGDQVSTLVATGAADDPARLQVSYKVNGNNVLIPDSSLNGGSLGGVLSYRTQTLDVAQNTLGRIAIVMASAFNAQHKLGQDQNGVLGTNFFTVGVPQVNGTSTNSATANVAATITNPSQLTTSDYQLKYDGTNYTFTRLSDGNQSIYPAASTTFPVVIDGVSYATPTMAAGDKLLIKPTINGSSSLSVAINNTQNIAAASPVLSSLNATTNMNLVTTGNTGTGLVTNASVNAASFTSGSTQTYTYSSAGTSLSLVPPASVTVTTTAGVTTTYASGAPIPFSSGATVTSGGVSFVLTGAPANGDKYAFSPQPANTGTGVISSGTINSSYVPLAPGTKYGFTFNAGTGTFTPSASVPMPVAVKDASGNPVTYTPPNIPFGTGYSYTTAGISFTITGQPAGGDQFFVGPNTNGVNDNRNAQALSALQTANTIGNTSFQGSYSQLTSFVGNKTNEVNVNNTAEKARFKAIQEAQQSESGVNQDEELSNMIKNQTAYQAAAKIIQAASDMLNVLFTLGR